MPLPIVRYNWKWKQSLNTHVNLAMNLLHLLPVKESNSRRCLRFTWHGTVFNIGNKAHALFRTTCHYMWNEISLATSCSNWSNLSKLTCLLCLIFFALSKKLFGHNPARPWSNHWLATWWASITAKIDHTVITDNLARFELNHLN